MVTLARLFRDYQDAASVNSLLALWGFADDEAFVTKGGHVGLVYRVDGIDYEGLTDDQRRTIVHQMEAGLRLLDEHCRVSQYLIKQTPAPFVSAPCAHPLADEAIQRRTAFLNARRHELSTVRVYLVILYEAPRRLRTSTRLLREWASVRQACGAWLSARQTCTLLEDELDAALVALYDRAHAFEVQLSEIGLHRLAKRDAFRFFRELVNYDPAVVDAGALAYDTHLDYFIADSTVECHRDHLTVGDQCVKVVSMKEPPARTFAHLLEGLYTLPGEFIACLEWRRLASDRVRRDLQARRRHFFNKRISLVNYVAPDTTADEMLVDESATATVRQLGDALTAMEVEGHFFGICSLTVVLHGNDLRAVQHQAAEAMKVIAIHDGSFFDERYNLLNAWLSLVPGNSAYNVRQLALLETNLADQSFVFALDTGEPVSPYLHREALAVFETRHNTPYAFNLHVEDVGHTLVLGATGSGKSFLLNFLMTQAQKYDPTTIVLDLGHSYRKLTTLLQGRHLELGLTRQAVTLNPFAFEPTADHLHFLHGFARVLLDGSDHYALSDLEDRELYEAIENVYVLDRPQHRLFTLAKLLPRHLGARLLKWIEGGRYAALFDHPEDTLALDRLQTFDFDAMDAYPAVLEPLLFYLLHRIAQRVHDPAETDRLKLCIVDEAWRFIQHPRLRAYVQEALKTWRKQNAALILATQTVDDFASVDLLRTVIESCPTKLLLANPALDRTQYAALFQMNEVELDLLTALTPRRQFLLKRPTLTKVLTLNVDPKSYWIYTNSPMDNAQLAGSRGQASPPVANRLAATHA